MKTICKNFSKIVFSFIIFISGLFVAIQPSYAKDFGDNASDAVNPLEGMEWVDENYPLKFDELANFYSNYGHFKMKVYDNVKNKKAYFIYVYNEEGKRLTSRQEKTNFDLNTSLNMDRYKFNEQIYIEDSFARPGDLITVTVVPKDKSDEEKIIGQKTLLAGPKFRNIKNLYEGFEFNENGARMFVANKNDLPKDTKYYFKSAKPVVNNKVAYIEIEIKMPNGDTIMYHNDFYYDNKLMEDVFTDSFIPVTSESQELDSSKRYRKVSYLDGDHGKITEGHKEFWMSEYSSVRWITTNYAPEVLPDKGYKFVGWDEEKLIDEDAYHLTAKYKKITDIGEGEASVNIKFLPGEGGRLEGSGEFELPKGYSFDDTGEYEAPVAVKDGYEFLGWEPEFNPKKNFYYNTTFKPIFKEIKNPGGSEGGEGQESGNGDQEPGGSEDGNNGQEPGGSEGGESQEPGDSEGDNDNQKPDNPEGGNTDQEKPTEPNSNNEDAGYIPSLPDKPSQDLNQKPSEAPSKELLEKIRVLSKQVEIKVNALDFIRENLPETYKRHKDIINQAILKAQESLADAQTYLAKYNK